MTPLYDLDDKFVIPVAPPLVAKINPFSYEFVFKVRAWLSLRQSHICFSYNNLPYVKFNFAEDRDEFVRTFQQINWIFIPNTLIEHSRLKTEVREWCEESCGRCRFEFMGTTAYMVFAEAKDMLHFKMRWW